MPRPLFAICGPELSAWQVSAASAETTYRALLHDHGFTLSMSGAGNCCDNATMESFWRTQKTEANRRG